MQGAVVGGVGDRIQRTLFCPTDAEAGTAMAPSVRPLPTRGYPGRMVCVRSGLRRPHRPMEAIVRAFASRTAGKLTLREDPRAAITASLDFTLRETIALGFIKTL